jgi:serine/threonine protein kinase
VGLLLQSDIWSMGCILYELATLRHAFEAPNLRALISKVLDRLVTWDRLINESLLLWGRLVCVVRW